MKKKGLFYIIDAFIASTIVLVTLFIVFNVSVTSSTTIQTSTLSKDYMNLLAKTTAGESGNELILDLRRNGTIESDFSLLEVIGLAYYKEGNGTNTLSYKIMHNLTANLLPRQYSLKVEINNGSAEDIIYSKIVKDEDDAEILIPARKLVFGIASAEDLFGPYIITVKVWE